MVCNPKAIMFVNMFAKKWMTIFIGFKMFKMVLFE